MIKESILSQDTLNLIQGITNIITCLASIATCISVVFLIKGRSKMER